MPAKQPKSYKFSHKPDEQLLSQLFREVEDSFVSFDKDGNIVINKDIICRSIYVEGDSLYIGGIKVNAPTFTDDASYWKYDREAKAIEFTSISITWNISAKTAAYTATFNDYLLCDGTFIVTMPDITSADIGKEVAIVPNEDSGIITAKGDGTDTFYGENELECSPGGTYTFRATTTSTWVLN
jgi:hypothetical protein